MLCAALTLLTACGNDTQSPPERVEARPEQLNTDEPGNLAPLDLVYVCGNKFLATNANRRPAQLTWRVVGSSEAGSITLPPGPIEDPGHSETELETTKKGIVELYQDGERVVRRRNLNRPCGAPAVASLMAAATEYLWSGASGSSVDLYRNGQRVKTTENDRKHTTVHQFTGTATWRVKVCQAGSTTVCSPERSITLSN